MARLVSGKAFKHKCSLAYNGIIVSSKGLIDPGAGGLVFVGRAFANQLSERFQTPIIRTTDEVELNAFTGKRGCVAREIIICGLDIDGRRFPNTPMILTDMEDQLIIGRKWFSKHDVLIDCKRRKLIYPDQRVDYIPATELAIPQEVLQEQADRTIDPAHQEDVVRREQAMAEEIRKKPWKPKILTRPTQRTDAQDNIQKTDRELTRTDEQLPVETKERTKKKKKTLSTDIALIGGASFHRSLRIPGSEFFVSSVYEINRLIEGKEEPTQEEETEEQLLQRTVPPQFHDLLRTFSKEESDKLPPNRSYDHKIKLTAEPSELGFHPLYHMNVDELRALKDYLSENLDKGFIEHCSAPFAAPVMFVRKASGALRLCIDYRKLNAITEKDRYPLPLLDETLARISRAKVFTKLDIRQAFNRIRMSPDAEELTSFRTRYGQFKCKVLPFGLTNGPATYQRYMNDVLFEYLDDFCTAYLDDILIYSEDPLEHEAHVRKVLERLQSAGLQADIKKCEFSVTSTKYLGFIISTDGIKVDPEKVTAIKSWSYPTSVKGVQAFLGFCNFYRRFIQSYGTIARPLNQCTRKDQVFDFDQSCRTSFDKLKEALCTAPVLSHYKPELESRLETDSSDGVVGGVFSQLQGDGLWRPVAYFSKTMLPAECNYTIHDKELLAIVRAFEQWRAELQALDEPLKVYSDHKALEYFMTKRDLSARQARWAELLSRFHFRIQYQTAAQNQKADALTRREEDTKLQKVVKKEAREQTMLPAETLSEEVQETLRTTEVATLEQATQPESIAIVDKILQANRTSPGLGELRDKAGEDGEGTYSLQDGLLLASGRLVVPDQDNLRMLIVREIHDQKATAHPGRKKTLQMLRSRYYWRGITGDAERYIRNCHTCRRTHVPRDKTPGLLHPLPIPVRPWQHVSMDFKSFPKSKNGFDAILVVVDRLGKRPISVPCYKTANAKNLAAMFIEHVWRYYGPPDTIVSDRGPQFISSFWNEFCTILGIKLKLSTAEQPQTDGQTEIVNQYIDQRLRPFVNYYQDDWDELLPIVDFAQASLPHEATGQSSFRTEMAFEPRTSFDWQELPAEGTASEKLNRQEAQSYVKKIQDSWEVARGEVKSAQERYSQQANKHRRTVDFDVGDKVWVSTKGWRTERPSKKLDYQQAGPYEIVKKEGHSFRLALPANIKVHPVFHASKLRKDPDDPLPGQRQEEPLPVIVEDEHEWEVEKILGVRVVRKQLRYRVQWVGFDIDPDEYLPEDLKHAPNVLQDFHKEYPSKPGPPRNLEYWLECAQRDVSPKKRSNDNNA
jgi:transposase InsO family protein